MASVKQVITSDHYKAIIEAAYRSSRTEAMVEMVEWLKLAQRSCEAPTANDIIRAAQVLLDVVREERPPEAPKVHRVSTRPYSQGIEYVAHLDNGKLEVIRRSTNSNAPYTTAFYYPVPVRRGKGLIGHFLLARTNKLNNGLGAHETFKVGEKK